MDAEIGVNAPVKNTSIRQSLKKYLCDNPQYLIYALLLFLIFSIYLSRLINPSKDNNKEVEKMETTVLKMLSRLLPTDRIPSPLSASRAFPPPTPNPAASKTT